MPDGHPSMFPQEKRRGGGGGGIEHLEAVYAFAHTLLAVLREHSKKGGGGGGLNPLPPFGGNTAPE